MPAVELYIDDVEELVGVMQAVTSDKVAVATDDFSLEDPGELESIRTSTGQQIATTLSLQAGGWSAHSVRVSFDAFRAEISFTPHDDPLILGVVARVGEICRRRSKSINATRAYFATLFAVLLLIVMPPAGWPESIVVSVAAAIGVGAFVLFASNIPSHTIVRLKRRIHREPWLERNGAELVKAAISASVGSIITILVQKIF